MDPLSTPSPSTPSPARRRRRLLTIAVVPVVVVAGLQAAPDRELPRANTPIALAAAEAVADDSPAARCLLCLPAATPSTTPEPAPAPAVATRDAAAPVRASRGGDRSRPLTVQERGRAALDALPYDWRSLGYSVEFRPYTGGRLGGADATRRLITVYVKSAQSEVSLRATIAHELAHALDFGHGTEQRRRQYVEVRGLDPRRSWFPCNGCDDLGSPAGDFAEVFAAWLVGPGDFRSRLAGPPSAEQLRRLEPLFRPGSRAAAAAPAPEAEPSPSPSPSPSQESTVDRIIGGGR